MSRREDRERKAAEWLEHLQGWKDSGTALSAYARSRGLALWAMYHWRNVLRREGRWAEEPRRRSTSAEEAKSGKRIPLRFARVALSELPRSVPLTVRVHLRNGRRAELDLSDRGELAAVLALLEQPA
jgi:hypothetical protein